MPAPRLLKPAEAVQSVTVEVDLLARISQGLGLPSTGRVTRHSWPVSFGVEEFLLASPLLALRACSCRCGCFFRTIWVIVKSFRKYCLLHTAQDGVYARGASLTADDSESQPVKPCTAVAPVRHDLGITVGIEHKLQVLADRLQQCHTAEVMGSSQSVRHSDDSPDQFYSDEPFTPLSGTPLQDPISPVCPVDPLQLDGSPGEAPAELGLPGIFSPLLGTLNLVSCLGFDIGGTLTKVPRTLHQAPAASAGCRWSSSSGLRGGTARVGYHPDRSGSSSTALGNTETLAGFADPVLPRTVCV